MCPGIDDDGSAAQWLLSGSAAATLYKPSGFNFWRLVLTIPFVLCLKRTGSPLPIHTVIDIIPLEDEREKKRRLKQIVKEKDLVALEAEFGGVREAFSFLHSQWDTPIDAIGELAQTGFWDSILLFVKGFWSCLYNSLNSCTIFLLVIAANLSLAIGSIEQGLKDGWHDCVGILLAVFLLVFFSSVLSFCKIKAEEKKRLKLKNNLKVTVKRHEELQEISVFDVKRSSLAQLSVKPKNCRSPY